MGVATIKQQKMISFGLLLFLSNFFLEDELGNRSAMGLLNGKMEVGELVSFSMVSDRAADDLLSLSRKGYKEGSRGWKM